MLFCFYSIRGFLFCILVSIPSFLYPAYIVIMSGVRNVVIVG